MIIPAFTLSFMHANLLTHLYLSYVQLTQIFSDILLWEDWELHRIDLLSLLACCNNKPPSKQLKLLKKQIKSLKQKGKGFALLNIKPKLKIMFIWLPLGLPLCYSGLLSMALLCPTILDMLQYLLPESLLDFSNALSWPHALAHAKHLRLIPNSSKSWTTRELGCCSYTLVPRTYQSVGAWF